MSNKVTSKYCIVTSDNHPGEFKSNNFSWFLQYLIQEKIFLRIDHRTLLQGHTYSSCDRHFGNIEKAILKKDVVELPADYINIIQAASLNGKYHAKFMTIKDIYDYKSYLSNQFTYRYFDVNGQQCLFEQSHYFNYGIGERPDDNGVVKTYSHPDKVWVRKTFNPLEIPQELDFMKKKQKKNLNICTLNCLNDKLKPLRLKTYKDANALASKYLSPSAQSFYRELPYSEIQE